MLLKRIFVLFFQMYPPHHQSRKISSVFYVEVGNFKNLCFKCISAVQSDFTSNSSGQQTHTRSRSVPWRSSEDHDHVTDVVLKHQTGGKCSYLDSWGVAAAIGNSSVYVEASSLDASLVWSEMFLPSDCWNRENEARLRVGVKWWIFL